MFRKASIDPEDVRIDNGFMPCPGQSVEEYTFTALQVAAFSGHVAVVECLLDYGANINTLRQTFGTALQAALEGEHLDVAEVLLARGADIDKHWGGFGTCLQVFSERGDMSVVEFLLDRGANMEDPGGGECDATGRNNGNALQAASANGNLGIIELLLCHGAKVNDADNGTESALWLAAANGHDQVAHFLLRNGAKVESIGALPVHKKSRDWYPRYRLLYEQEGRFADPASAVSILMRAEAAAKPSPPLLAACYGGFTSIAKLLFNFEPWSYIHKGSFTSALEASLEHRRDEVSAMLVRDGVRVGFKPEHFNSAFEYACIKGCLGFVNEILKHFAVTNWPHALLLAADQGQSAVVELLVENGAELDTCDKYNNSALELAINEIQHSDIRYAKGISGWMSVVRILTDAGADIASVSAKLQDIAIDPAQYAEALMAASRAGQAKMAHYICTKRVPTPTEVTAAILAAIKAGRSRVETVKRLMETVKELLRFNIALLFGNDHPLIIASGKRLTEIVTMLLQNTRHDTFVIDRSLEAAVRSNHVSCTRAIVDSQAWDIDHLTLCACTIASHVSYRSEDMLAYPLSLGVHPDTRDPQSNATLLYMAAVRGDYNGVKSLITYGADICLERSRHGTALHAAVEGGWKNVTELLLSAGADANSKCESYN
ncbi:hypothetical protein SI65_01340 [Aspergillus cristatus]|uniref:Uncharacterized protein n=1 Tax=Aspergillus cristatus TaxID=573508 RepID=A0A1E3BSJ3_ASPCR|nr:hypothetical protein SI65_01340 [Aspergillus cristatus]